MISFKTGASKEYIDGFCRIFGDEVSFIHKVLGCANEVFEIYENNKFAGGLCVLDVSVKSGYSIKNGAYIYGAYICESARGRGLFRQLCDHVFDYYRNEFYDFALTIPASKELFPAYERLGFTSSLGGCVSIVGDDAYALLPENTEFFDFDGDYNSLYFMHIEKDMLIKDFDLFKRSVSDFDIKYIELNGERGYALLQDRALIYASAPFVQYKTAKKALVCPFTDVDFDNKVLCDILFEV